MRVRHGRLCAPSRNAPAQDAAVVIKVLDASLTDAAVMRVRLLPSAPLPRPLAAARGAAARGGCVSAGSTPYKATYAEGIVATLDVVREGSDRPPRANQLVDLSR